MATIDAGITGDAMVSDGHGALDLRTTLDAEAAPIGFAVVDTDGTVLRANAALSRMLERDRTDLIGVPVISLTGSGGEAELLSATIDLTSAGSQHCDLRLQRSDGELVWASLDLWRTDDDSVQMVVAAQSAPSDVQYHVETLIDRSPTAMAHVGPDLRLRHLNERWSVITGQTPEDALGAGWLDAVDVEGRAQFVGAIERSIRTGSGIRGRLRLAHTDGEPRWVDVTTTPLLPGDGAVISCADITDELEATRRAEELTRVLEVTPDLVAILDKDGDEVLWANDALRRVLPEQPEGFASMLDEWSSARFRSSALPAVARAGSWRGELSLISDESEPLPMSVALVGHGDEQGIDAISLVARDLSELRQAEEKMLASEVRLAALVEHASELVCVIGEPGQIVYASPAATRVLRYRPGALVGRQARDLVHPDDAARYSAWMSDVLHSLGDTSAIEMRVRDADGDYRHLEVVATNLIDNPAISGIVLNARDVSDRVAAAAALEARAYHDQLTGLPNRAKLLDHLELALNSAKDRDRLVGVLFIDLDRFKVVNDSLGHAAGDELLREVADRIHEIIRPSDTVARLGGDEFVIVLHDMTKQGDAMIAARRIRRAIARPVSLSDQEAVTTASIGIAVSDGSHTPADLLRDADIALYQAKEEGRDRADLFDDRLRERAVRRLSVEQQIRQAVENDAIVVHYQPVIRLDDGAVIGCEALARLVATDGSLVEPEVFIGVAEESGLIIELGRRVLAASCRNLTDWTNGREATVSVNVSARQLADSRLASLVSTELATARIEPASLCLELTETALIGASPVVERNLAHLSNLGVRLGLDDFGTGFSSLVHLKRFPIDFVKIDRSFVDGLGTDDNDSAIVRATIALAHSLGLRVVAEGVESDTQLQELERLGCDLAQGYLFARPVPEHEFAQYLDLRWSTG